MHSLTQSNEILCRQALQNICQQTLAKNLVDIGSGDGTFSLQLAKLTHATRVLCVDHDLESLKKAQKRGCAVLRADLNHKLSIPSNTYDIAIINQVIEHVAKTDNLAKEVYRILKPGAFALWCTPNLASWHNIFALIFGLQPFSSQISDQAFLGNPWHPQYKKSINEEQAHLRLFTHKSLAELLTLHGFTIEQVEGIGFYPNLGLYTKTIASLDRKHSAYILIKAIKNKV
jgi:2-polyprenyl-3-methyl-5-hydroxy-6-metoxy-1,4-benzoquinol methylase